MVLFVAAKGTGNPQLAPRPAWKRAPLLPSLPRRWVEREGIGVPGEAELNYFFFNRDELPANFPL